VCGKERRPEDRETGTMGSCLGLGMSLLGNFEGYAQMPVSALVRFDKLAGHELAGQIIGTNFSQALSS